MEKILTRQPRGEGVRLIRALVGRRTSAAAALGKPLADAAKRSSYTSHELRSFLLAAAPVEECCR